MGLHSSPIHAPSLCNNVHVASNLFDTESITRVSSKWYWKVPILYSFDWHFCLQRSPKTTSQVEVKTFLNAKIINPTITSYWNDAYN